VNEEPGDYAGFVTRAIAFAIDVALIDLAAAFVAVVVGLGMSALDLPDVVVTITIAIGTLAYLAWSQRPSQAHHHPGRLRHRPRGVNLNRRRGVSFPPAPTPETPAREGGLEFPRFTDEVGRRRARNGA
jgi:hypothetical protein